MAEFRTVKFQIGKSDGVCAGVDIAPEVRGRAASLHGIGAEVWGGVAQLPVVGGGLDAARPRRRSRVREYAAIAGWVVLLGLMAASAVRAQEPGWESAAGRRARAAKLVAERGGARAVTAAGRPAVLPRAGSLAAAWVPLGPAAVLSASYGKVSGRVTAVAVDASDTSGNTVYVGTTGGGVWKSTNAAGALAGVSFSPLTDTLPVFAANGVASLSIGALAVQPGSNPVVLAGTGDPNDATDSYYGEGILRTADGGLTWTLVQGSRDGANGNHSFIGLGVAGMAWSSATPGLVVAALSRSVEGEIVGARNAASVAGLYVSSDAGVTWQMATVYDGASVVQEPQPLGTGQVGNAATAVVWNPVRQKFYAALRQHGFYESADGVTWTRLASQPGTGMSAGACPVGVNGAGGVGCPVFRGALAVQPVSGDMYALSVDSGNHDNGLWQDLCVAGAGGCAGTVSFGARIDGGAMEVGSGSTVVTQGDYNLALAAAATSSGTVLLVGTVDVYRCVIAAGSGGCSLRNTTNALNGCNAPAMVAPAQHTLAAFGAAPVVWVGNDGGLWRSLDGVAETGAPCSAADAQHFENVNGALGSLAEVVGFAQDPAVADTLLAGMGANGSAATTKAAADWSARGAWAQMSAGEGGFPLIDPGVATNWSIAAGAGVSEKFCGSGGACTAADFAGTATVGAVQVSGDASVLDAPVMLDPGLTAELVVGTCRVWRGMANGAGWSTANAVSKPLGGGTVPCTSASALVRSVGAGGPVAASSNAQHAGSTVLYAGMAGTVDGGRSVGGHVFVTTAGATADSATAWTDVGVSPVTNDVANAHVFNPFGFDVSAVVVDGHDASGGTVYATVMGFGSLLAASPHVYRSADFGAHWVNVSANLPDVPANALAVDPNDANSVYVATDTGVYVTSQVLTCTTANCWSLMGTGLPNAPVTGLAASTAMLTGDGRKGMLRAGTYGRGMWAVPLLSATNLLQPAMAFSATDFTFPQTAVNAQSAAQTLTITSTGNSPVTFGSVVVAGDFVETDNCAGQTLPVGATCAVQLRFAPSVVGPRTGVLTVFANVVGGQGTATLEGTGTTPAAIVLTPNSLTFAATIVNQTTAAQIITVSNTGGTPAGLQTPVVTGDFAITANTCGATLAASTGCSIAIAFTPTASGARSGTLSITDDAGTQVATLTGTGNAPATDALGPLSLTFGPQVIGTASTAQQVLLTNAGDVALTLVTTSVTGPFTAVSACGTSLAAHSSCAVSVAFVPSATGSVTGVLTVGDQFRSQTVALAGTGLAPAGVSLTPVAGLGFGQIGVGLTSPPQTLTLTNNGGVALGISSIGVSGDFRLASSTCGVSLAAGQACAMVIVFVPTVGGARTGVVTLIDTAASGTQTVALTGTGIDFTLAATGPTSVTVASGTSAVYTLVLTAPVGVNGSAAVACTGAPAHSLCTVAPSPVTLGGSVNVTVTVQTGLATASVQRPFAWLGDGVVLALLLPLMMRRRKLAALVVMLVVVSVSGCGAGRQLPTDGGSAPPTPTPVGTYNLTVSGSASGVSRSVGLVLVVK